MYQTEPTRVLGRRRSRDASRLAEVMRKHFDPAARDEKPAVEPPAPKRRGRPRKVKE
jgi:hypothetical protein